VAGGQTLRLLTVGKSGSGKSTLNKDILRALRGRYRHLVICNIKRELSEFVPPWARFVVSDGERVDEEKLYRFIKRYRRVFFQVIDPKPQAFMDKLGRAVMRLRHVHVVVDEAHNLLEHGKEGRGFLMAITGGREQGISFQFITQSVMAGAGGLSKVVQRQCTHFITFRLTDVAEVKRILEMFGELGEGVARLARYNPQEGDPHPSEYAVKHMDASRAEVVRRDPADPARLRAYRLGS
jgi:hypothetical protein